MKRRLSVRLRIFYILPLILLLFGCATPMQMRVQEYSQIDDNEGIVVGSVLMKGGKDILGRKRWVLYATEYHPLKFHGLLPSLFMGKRYSIKVVRGREEAIFVTKMLAGKYHFNRLEQHGFSTFRADLNVPFTVHPGKTVYIGRLVLEFSGLLMVGSRFSITIEDAKDQTLASAEKTYGNLVRNAVTDLMRPL